MIPFVPSQSEDDDTHGARGKKEGNEREGRLRKSGHGALGPDGWSHPRDPHRGSPRQKHPCRRNVRIAEAVSFTLNRPNGPAIGTMQNYEGTEHRIEPTRVHERGHQSNDRSGRFSRSWLDGHISDCPCRRSGASGRFPHLAFLQRRDSCQ